MNRKAICSPNPLCSSNGLFAYGTHIVKENDIGSATDVNTTTSMMCIEKNNFEFSTLEAI